MSREADIALLAEEARSQEEFIDRAARLCMEWIGADRAVFMDLRDERDGVRPVGFDDESLRRYHECQHIMPSLAPEIDRVVDSMLKTRVYVEDEVYSTAERSRLRVFTEIARPQRAYTNSAVLLEWRGRPVAALRFERVGTNGPRFTRETLEPLVAPLPMLSLAWAAVSGQSSLPVAGDVAVLTARERQLCRYVARGLHNGEIARLMGTSPNTVRNQLSTLFKKVDVTTRTELALWYESALAGNDDDEGGGPPLRSRIVKQLADSSARFLRRALTVARVADRDVTPDR